MKNIYKTLFLVFSIHNNSIDILFEKILEIIKRDGRDRLSDKKLYSNNLYLK